VIQYSLQKKYKRNVLLEKESLFLYSCACIPPRTRPRKILATTT